MSDIKFLTQLYAFFSLYIILTDFPLILKFIFNIVQYISKMTNKIKIQDEKLIST